MQAPNHDCPRRYWPLLGCKFEARYNVSTVLPSPFPNVDANSVFENTTSIIDSMKTTTTTYAADVCVRCGRNYIFSSQLNITKKE